MTDMKALVRSVTRLEETWYDFQSFFVYNGTGPPQRVPVLTSESKRSRGKRQFIDKFERKINEVKKSRKRSL